MVNKIQKVYEDIQDKYVLSYICNTMEERTKLRTKLIDELGLDVKVICDETNNTSDIIGSQNIVARILFNFKGCEYSYVDLIFG
jgi:hypothetical protein